MIGDERQYDATGRHAAMPICPWCQLSSAPDELGPHLCEDRGFWDERRANNIALGLILVELDCHLRDAQGGRVLGDCPDCRVVNLSPELRAEGPSGEAHREWAGHQQAVKINRYRRAVYAREQRALAALDERVAASKRVWAASWAASWADKAEGGLAAERG